MAKPTDFQKRVIEAIKSELDYWEQSNDIHSPSHQTSINEMFINMPEWDFGLGPREKELEEIAYVIHKLHGLVAYSEPSGR